MAWGGPGGVAPGGRGNAWGPRAPRLLSSREAVVQPRVSSLSRPSPWTVPPAPAHSLSSTTSIHHRSKAHVPLRTFDDPAQALAYFSKGPAAALASRKRVLSLNGAWRFKLYDQPEAVPEGVWEEGFDDGDWTDVSSQG